MKKLFSLIKYFVIVIIFITFNISVVKILNNKERNTEELKNKIVLISHVYSNPYWQYVRAGAEKAAEENNIIVEYQGPDYADVNEGIKLINMANAAKVQGIITYVQDGSKYNSTINNVVENGIPLITVDSDAEESKRLAYVGTDNVKSGEIAGEETVKLLGDNGKVAIIMGGIETKNQLERVRGFKEYVGKHSNIEIVSIESSESYLLEAELAAKKIITNNEEIDALFCVSAQDGIGAAKALSNSGLSGKIKIICFDDLPQTLEALEKNEVDVIIAQDPYEMGYKSVNMLIDILHGENVDSINFTDVYVINSENIDEYIKTKRNKLNEN